MNFDYQSTRHLRPRPDHSTQLRAGHNASVHISHCPHNQTATQALANDSNTRQRPQHQITTSTPDTDLNTRHRLEALLCPTPRHFRPMRISAATENAADKLLDSVQQASEVTRSKSGCITLFMQTLTFYRRRMSPIPSMRVKWP
jgi:hypothetical protein